MDKLEFPPQEYQSAHPTRTISISSGKGGVGKSTITANLALMLEKQGKRVLILDGDLGMANLDILFDIRSKYNLSDLLLGKDIEDILVEVSPGIDLIPGGSGIYEMQNLSLMEKSELFSQVSKLSNKYDYLLVDTAPGIDDKVLYLNAATDENIIVVTPDPSSITDSYALIKLLNKMYKRQKFSVLCNFVKDEREALKVFKRISDVAEEHLCVGLDYVGCIPLDHQLRNATKLQQLIVKSNPRTASSFAIQDISKKINSYSSLHENTGGINLFCQNLVGLA